MGGLSGEREISILTGKACSEALKKKGFIKLKNFAKNPNKLNYFYVLTPKGIAEKTNLTVNFMKRKIKEYDELKKDLEQ